MREVTRGYIRLSLEVLQPLYVAYIARNRSSRPIRAQAGLESSLRCRLCFGTRKMLLLYQTV